MHPVDGLIGPDDIEAAARRIGAHVLRSPLVPMTCSDVLLKAECLQRTGAFKLRGAVNALLQLDDDERHRGVVAHSSGNHAIAVACAAQMFGAPATIVMPSDAPEVKLSATRAFGAEVVLVGPSSDERTATARRLADERGLVLVEPYDSRAVIAATATIGVEIVEDAPEVAEVYVPVSGGGLAAGVARAVHLMAPHVRVIGVEPEVAADALASLRAGRRVTLPGEQMARTIADGLRVQTVGEMPWEHLRRHLHDVVTVSEDEILTAMAVVARYGRLVAEPSGAVACAAALAAERRDAEREAGSSGVLRVAVVSGGNVDPALLALALSR